MAACLSTARYAWQEAQCPFLLIAAIVVLQNCRQADNPDRHAHRCECVQEVSGGSCGTELAAHLCGPVQSA